jgi:hypothetical protein
MSDVMESESESGSGKEEAPGGVSMAQVFVSILASFYGVQSSKNRKRDFQSGKAKHFIAAGIIMTGLWYFSIYLIVTVVLQNAR